MVRISDNRGFSLVEMIVVMAMFVVVIAIAGDAFNRIVTGALTQTKKAETNIAGIVGLELMRADVESAGFGLPWSFMNTATYDEAANAPGNVLNDNGRNYASDPTQTNVPRAVVSVNNHTGGTVLNGADVLAIRAMTVNGDPASRKWSYIESQVLPTGNPSPVPVAWTSENLSPSDRIVMVQPIADMKPVNRLVVSSTGAWSASFANYATIGVPPVYSDVEHKSDAYVIYGVKSFVGSDSEPRMPFNRADFYVKQPASGLPQRCNSSTGMLYKGVISHADGNYLEYPLLACVADMQVVYGVLTPGSSATVDMSDITGMSPKEIREQVKEIKVYILTHDGGKDNSYRYPNATVGVGPGDGITSGTGRTFDFAANGVTDWQNYRWRVYQIIGRPRNIAGNSAE